MLLTFYIHGRGRDEPEPMSWAKDAWGYILMYGKEAGQYLGLIEPTVEEPVQVVKQTVEGVKESSGPGWMSRMFGGLTRSPGETKSVQRGLPPPGTYKTGEVHGDYVKVSWTFQESADIRMRAEHTNCCLSSSTFPAQRPRIQVER